ncbi:hypothetical protein DL765_008338 [Monosporascus sp. GIB2]|nr:hypothetical protein DL765_008338 [Monosporascus sp. GIB2]
MEISKVAASWLSACQETNIGLATVNLDFSLVKVEPPEEFRAVGRELTHRRKEAAENGSQHITARKLGALFQHCLPRTSHLIKAYGKRASEIASCPGVNPKPSASYGIFAEHVGLDGTSLWAAATSGPEAISVHLLACLLARMWTPSQALAIWTELVSERKKELESTDEIDPFHHISQQLSRISLTSDQLAAWDASTRAWLQGADEAMGRKHVQLGQVATNLSVTVNSTPSLYGNVMQTWTRSMEVVNNLILGRP